MVKMVTWFGVLVVTLVGGCTERELDPADPASSFVLARAAYDEGFYEQSLKKLQEFKARFPYSRYATDAELLIADCFYQQQRFTEAVVAYEQFAKLHPNHPKRPFALYRVGDAHWQVAPTAVDREQDMTAAAVKAWQALVQAYPNDSLSEQARRLIASGEQRIVDALAFSANFYCRREIWHACAYRHLKLIKHYGDKEAYRAAMIDSLKKAGTALQQLARARKQASPTVKERGGGQARMDANLFFVKYSAKELEELARNLQIQASKLQAHTS